MRSSVARPHCQVLIGLCILLPGLMATAERGPRALSVTQISRETDGIGDRVQEASSAELRAFVIIVGPGSALVSRFGHSALWIKDDARGIDIVYSYGLSNAMEDGFVRRLTTGEAISRPSAHDPSQMIQSYRAQDRSVEVLELNLSTSQQLALLAYLNVDLTTKGRGYPLDLYLTNCTTSLRDVIDGAVGGQLRAATADRTSQHSYRSLTMGYVAADLPLRVGFSLVLGQPVDGTISVWEEMFLPFTLRDRLLEVQVRHDDGKDVPLVLSHTATGILARPHVASERVWQWPAFLMLGSVLGVAMTLLGRAASVKHRARLALRFIGSAWLLTAGALGVLLVALWALTDQHWAYGNENLLQLNPLLLLGAPMLWVTQQKIRYLRWCMLSLAMVSVLGVVLKITPNLYQANESLIALMAPVHVGLACGFWRMGSQAGSPTRDGGLWRHDKGQTTPGPKHSVGPQVTQG